VRWMLDEFPLPGRLFEEVFELLYRENQFARGLLSIGARRTGVDRLRCPVLAVVNPAGGIVPPESVRVAIGVGGQCASRVLTYEGECGPALQHLGPLVAAGAHQRLWPAIITWLVESG